jgi:hypothetical protein
LEEDEGMSFDEMYDEMLHDEFQPGSARHAAKRPATGLARYRTAALVSAGGLAAATAGAFLGGLGGYFTVSPASGSPLTSASTEVPLAAAAQAAYHAQQAVAPAAAPSAASTITHVTNDAPSSAVATFAAAAGPLLNGVAPLTGPTVSGTTAGPSAPSSTPITAGGSTTPANSLGQAGQILTVSLTDMLGNLTSAITDIPSLPGNPAGSIQGLVTPLTGVLSDLTSTLTNLSSLMPLPVSTLPVLAASAPGSGPVAGTSHPASTSASSSGSPSAAATSLVPVLNSVAATVGGVTGGGLPNIPSLPLPPVNSSAPTLPSLPVTTSNGTLPKLPVISVPGVPVTLPVPVPSAGSTCVALPTSALPVNMSLPLKLGPVSVGVSTGGASSGATVCAG